MARKDYSTDIKNALYLGVGLIILYNLNNIIKGISNALTPDPKDPKLTEADKKAEQVAQGVHTETMKKGTGLNLKRTKTDTALNVYVDKLKEAINSTIPNQQAIQNSLIPVGSDADYNYMSKVFGTKFSYSEMASLNMTEWIRKTASAYSKDRINQSWAINKKFPNKITFKI